MHHRPPWVILSIAAALLAIAVLLVARSVPTAASIVTDVRLAEEHITAAMAVWGEISVRGAGRVRGELAPAGAALQRAQEQLESLAYLDFIPIVAPGRQKGLAAVMGTQEWVRGAEELASIVADGAGFAKNLEGRTPASLTPRERADIMELIGRGLQQSRHALERFDRGDAFLARASCPRSIAWVVPACHTLHDIQEQAPFRDFRQQLRTVLNATDQLIVQVAGSQPLDILLLFLNNTELRPGGGFLGTYGLLRVQRGGVVEFTVDDIYNLDRQVIGTQRIAPPEPFRRHGIVSYWYLRDANWSPDFPTSSETVLDFYAREHGTGNPTIVIGFTPTLIASLMELIGPVVVDGVQFTPQDLASDLEFQVERAYVDQGIPREQRKAIIGPLSETVAARVMELPFHRIGDVLTRVSTAIAERQLMAYARDPGLQSLIVTYEADGAVDPLDPGTDGLLVVDANLGALKTDPVIDRSIRYAIVPDGDGFRGVVQLRYRNIGSFTWKTTRYRTYVRVFVPEGSRLIRAHGAMARDRSDDPGPVDVGTELQRAWFGAFVSVEPGAERTIAFEFSLAPQLAEEIRRGMYTLHATKQLGGYRSALTVDHEFGTPLRAATPPEAPEAWGDSRYLVETDLRVDRVFQVNLTP